jgi:anthranilate phosphoribosyltransferase
VLRNRIVAALRASTSASEVKEHAIQAVTAHIAYATASPIEIAAALAHLAHDGRSVFKESTVEDVMSLVEKYTKSSPDIPAPEARKVRKRKRSEVVVAITGTTGGLGSHLLDECLRHPNIVRVYALNRRRDSGPQAYERQEQSFCKR